MHKLEITYVNELNIQLTCKWALKAQPIRSRLEHQIYSFIQNKQNVLADVSKLQLTHLPIPTKNTKITIRMNVFHLYSFKKTESTSLIVDYNLHIHPFQQKLPKLQNRRNVFHL